MPRVPYITDGLPGVGGLLKSTPEDFIVEEVPAYHPSGQGDHLFLTVEKRGVTTHEMVRRIARALSIPPTAIGVAGQKDRQAVSRQLVSVPVDNGEMATRASNLKLDGITVLSAARHSNKLRTGHLKGNRFHITLRGVHDDAGPRARAILDRVSLTWLPNFFGEQRFGRDGDNAEKGKALLLGTHRVHDRFQRRFLLSAYQANLYNRYLTQRLDEGSLHRVIDGEVLQRTDSGGLFLAAPSELAFNQARLEARQVVPAGPIFGHKMYACAEGSLAAQREQRILDEEGISAASFASFGKLAEGTRRALLVNVEGVEAVAREDRLEISFALPSGSYATVLLDELMKNGAAGTSEAGEPLS